MFVDDSSGVSMVYFLKAKSDTCEATKKFSADIAPFGQIKTLRSDNGTEFTCSGFESLLVQNKDRHESTKMVLLSEGGGRCSSWRDAC